MSKLLLATALLAATASFVPAAQAAPSVNWHTVGSNCLPDNADSQKARKVSADGSALHVDAGMLTRLSYTCNVPYGPLSASTPWRWLRLQTFDPAGASFNAILWAKDRVSGATTQAAAGGSGFSSGINNVHIQLPALDFTNNMYYVQVVVIRQETTPIELHMLSLTTDCDLC